MCVVGRGGGVRACPGGHTADADDDDAIAKVRHCHTLQGHYPIGNFSSAAERAVTPNVGRSRRGEGGGGYGKSRSRYYALYTTLLYRCLASCNITDRLCPVYCTHAQFRPAPPVMNCTWLCTVGSLPPPRDGDEATHEKASLKRLTLSTNKGVRG